MIYYIYLYTYVSGYTIYNMYAYMIIYTQYVYIYTYHIDMIWYDMICHIDMICMYYVYIYVYCIHPVHIHILLFLRVNIGTPKQITDLATALLLAFQVDVHSHVYWYAGHISWPIMVNPTWHGLSYVMLMFPSEAYLGGIPSDHLTIFNIVIEHGHF